MDNDFVGFETLERKKRTKEWWSKQSLFRRHALCDKCSRTIKRPTGWLIEQGTSLSIGTSVLIGGADLICDTCYSYNYWIHDLISDLSHHDDPSVPQNAAQRLAAFEIDDAAAGDIGSAHYQMIQHGWDPETGERLASSLSNADPKTRKRALEIVYAYGLPHSDIIPPLISCLKDSDQSIRTEAIKCLTPPVAPVFFYEMVHNSLSLALEDVESNAQDAIHQVKEYIGKRVESINKELKKEQQQYDKVHRKTRDWSRFYGKNPEDIESKISAAGISTSRILSSRVARDSVVAESTASAWSRQQAIDLAKSKLVYGAYDISEPSVKKRGFWILSKFVATVSYRTPTIVDIDYKLEA
jgi:hypothetical protein